MLYLVISPATCRANHGGTGGAEISSGQCLLLRPSLKQPALASDIVGHGDTAAALIPEGHMGEVVVDHFLFCGSRWHWSGLCSDFCLASLGPLRAVGLSRPALQPPVHLLSEVQHEYCFCFQWLICSRQFEQECAVSASNATTVGVSRGRLVHVPALRVPGIVHLRTGNWPVHVCDMLMGPNWPVLEIWERESDPQSSRARWLGPQRPPSRRCAMVPCAVVLD